MKQIIVVFILLSCIACSNSERQYADILHVREIKSYDEYANAGFIQAEGHISTLYKDSENYTLVIAFENNDVEPNLKTWIFDLDSAYTVDSNVRSILADHHIFLLNHVCLEEDGDYKFVAKTETNVLLAGKVHSSSNKMSISYYPPFQ